MSFPREEGLGSRPGAGTVAFLAALLCYKRTYTNGLQKSMTESTRRSSGSPQMEMKMYEAMIKTKSRPMRVASPPRRNIPQKGAPSAEAFPAAYNLTQKFCEGRLGPRVPPTHLRSNQPIQFDAGRPQALRNLYWRYGVADAHDDDCRRSAGVRRSATSRSSSMYRVNLSRLKSATSSRRTSLKNVPTMPIAFNMFLNLTSRGQNLLRELAPLRRKANVTTFRSLTEERAKLWRNPNALISDGNIALRARIPSFAREKGAVRAIRCERS